jgi:hypothetical protein
MSSPDGKTLAQKAADRAMDEAVAKVIRAYNLLPEEATPLEVASAYWEVASGLMTSALDIIQEYTNGDAEAVGAELSEREGSPAD